MNKQNSYLTKSKILIRLSLISSEFTKLAIELNELNPETDLYKYFIKSKLLASRKFIDKLYLEARQIDVNTISVD